MLFIPSFSIKKLNLSHGKALVKMSASRYSHKVISLLLSQFEWGDEQENAFQTLKDMLCDAPILALRKGPNDFVIELFGDYDCEIRYHPGKANVVADALSRKDWMKPRRVRAMSMTIHSRIKARILEAQSEASKGANTPA
ncbi:hypothetical protein Tco_0517408 [Tanacetum coccineum]